VRKDDHAFRWDIVDNGTVNDGSNDAYDGGMRLQVNDEYFPSLSSAWASQDNLEIEIGPWRRGQLAVSRRIFVNRQAGYCRWIDLFENTGGSEAELKVMYHSNMGQSTGDTYTSSGKAQLTEKDWGIVTGQAASATSYPSIVHVFATPAAKFRPSFHCTRGNDDLYYRATFKVPPRKAAALCFFEAQRRPFQEAVAFLKKFNVGQELRLVPAPLRRILLNMPGGMLTVEGIELNRNHEADTVVLRNGDEILGRISNPRFVVKTEFGESVWPTGRN